MTWRDKANEAKLKAQAILDKPRDKCGVWDHHCSGSPTEKEVDAVIRADLYSSIADTLKF